MFKLMGNNKFVSFLNRPSEQSTFPEPILLSEPLTPSPELLPLQAPFNTPPLSMCFILELPTEIFYRVASLITTDPLADGADKNRLFSQLVLVNKRLNRVYTPLLYEHVYLNSYGKLSMYYRNPGAMNSSCFTKSLSIAAIALVNHSAPPGGETWAQILSPLARMQNLRTLNIHRSGGINKSTCPALDCLASWSIYPEFVPNLSTLKMPYYPKLLALCKERPIKMVSLGPNVTPVSDKVFEEHISNLGSGTRPVEDLSLYWPSDGDVDSFDGRTSRIVELCPELQALEMRLPKNFANFIGWHANNFDSVFARWVQRQFASLSQLKYLHLHISQPQEIPMEMRKSAVKAISAVLPNLNRIVLPVVQCEWSRTPNCDGFTGWTPRPNLGYGSIDWWLDFLELDDAAHVGYVAYMTRGGYINGYPHKHSERLDKQLGRTSFCEDITRVTDMMRKYWEEDCIPPFNEIEAALFERARRLAYTQSSFVYEYDFLDTPL